MEAAEDTGWCCSGNVAVIDDPFRSYQSSRADDCCRACRDSDEDGALTVRLDGHQFVLPAGSRSDGIVADAYFSGIHASDVGRGIASGLSGIGASKPDGNG